MKQQTIQIKVHPDVQDYLKSKGKNTFTLEICTSGGGCCPTIEIAEVILHAPDNSNLYHDIEQDGLRIYISKKARISAPVLQFVLRKKFF